MQKATALIASVLISAILSSCTKPGETTGIGAATGGVLGAGLGAIVGNQTGDAGSGMVIGAVAGSSAGALVGNALQAQEEAIATQDEAIERQEQKLKAQNSELEELRRMGSDTSSVRGSYRGAYGSTSRSTYPARAPSNQRSLKEATLVAPSVQDSEQASKNFRQRYADGSDYGGVMMPEESVSPASAVGAITQDGECMEADAEVSKASASAEMADKLFHYRRALRICPHRASYHNGLGEVYLALNRSADAEFEFREAVKIDPTFEAAKKNLAALGR